MGFGRIFGSAVFFFRSLFLVLKTTFFCFFFFVFFFVSRHHRLGYVSLIKFMFLDTIGVDCLISLFFVSLVLLLNCQFTLVVMFLFPLSWRCHFTLGDVSLCLVLSSYTCCHFTQAVVILHSLLSVYAQCCHFTLAIIILLQLLSLYSCCCQFPLNNSSRCFSKTRSSFFQSTNFYSELQVAPHHGTQFT